MLAASHAIGTNAYSESEVAIFLAGLLLQMYPEALAARYRLVLADLARAAEHEPGGALGEEEEEEGGALAALHDGAVPASPAATAAASPDGVSVVEAIAGKRGYRVKGAGFDFDKAAITLLTDYRGGALGRISLETPQTRKV